MGEGEDADDLIERLTYGDPVTGDEIEPSEEIVVAIQNMIGQSYTYEAFLANLNRYPAEGGGDLIRAEFLANPNIGQVFNNLKTDADLITTLDNELAGINETDQETDLENFVSSISGITNKTALFGIYDQAVEGKDPALHGQFFNALEAQLGVEDIGEEYMEYRGLPSLVPEPEEKDVGSLQASQKELALGTLENINQEIAADSTWLAQNEAAIDSLEQVQDYSYDRFLELAKLDPDNVDPYLLPSSARMVWWGFSSPENSIEEEIARLGQEYRNASATQGRMIFPYPTEKRLEGNRVKRMDIERSLKLLEEND